MKTIKAITIHAITIGTAAVRATATTLSDFGRKVRHYLHYILSDGAHYRTSDGEYYQVKEE